MKGNSMPRRMKHIWFVVADGAQANVFSLNAGGVTLSRVDDMGLSGDDVRIPARDLKSDKPGRSFSSGNGGLRHAIEPHHDYHKMEKHKFTIGLAKALQKACEAGRFDQLVIVAPSRSLGELRAVLSGEVRSRVAYEVAKDLTKHPAETLWLHLAPVAQKLLRAVA
jgi:protein required for attachment to host cells